MSLERLTLFGSQYHAENDDDPQGGQIDLSKKIILTQLSSPDSIEISPINLADASQIYLVEGIDITNRYNSETIPVGQTGDVIFKRITKIAKISGPSITNNIIIRGSVSQEIVGIFSSKANSSVNVETTTLVRLLHKAATSPTRDKNFFEKVYIYNLDLTPMGTATDPVTLSGVVLKEFLDKDERTAFAIELVINSDTSSVNRLNPPVGGTTGFQSASIDLPDIPTNSYLGLWVRMSRPKSSTEIFLDYTIRFVEDFETSDFRLIINETPNTVLETAIDLRSQFPLGGGNPLQFVELANGRVVPKLFYEPDPSSFRNEYYYNSRLNRLYRKLATRDFKVVWKFVR